MVILASLHVVFFGVYGTSGRLAHQRRQTRSPFREQIPQSQKKPPTMLHCAIKRLTQCNIVAINKDIEGDTESPSTQTHLKKETRR